MALKIRGDARTILKPCKYYKRVCIYGRLSN